jgi:ABC-type multidrug transport system fused ATPase/permease subunit
MQAVGASSRIFQLLDRKPEIPVRGGEKGDKFEGHIEFNKVTFQYPSRKDNKILDNISLTIKPGTVLALVGPSGGGKSTIVSLMERFYDVPEGDILIDGRNIKDLDPEWYRSHVALVSQEPVLFATSIKENISYGISREVTMSEIENAAIKANAHNFISDFAEKYETQVGERGVRLSGGQKQRIAIARALLLNPKILLLDEATSALDAESEYLVQDAIEKAMHGRTVLIIAHRLSTVKKADVIAVLSGGRIVEKGSHQELLELDGLYKKLVNRQMESGQISMQQVFDEITRQESTASTTSNVNGINGTNGISSRTNCTAHNNINDNDKQ